MADASTRAQHPHLIIKGAVWRMQHASERGVPITLPIIQTSDEPPIEPSIIVVVKDRSRRRRTKAKLTSAASQPGQ